MKNQNTQQLLSYLFATKDPILAPIFAQMLAPWDVNEAVFAFLTKEFSFKPFNYPFVYLKNEKQIYLGKNVHIEKGALIEGPCFLGDNVSIGQGALIRSGTFLASNVHIGHCSEVTRSVFLEGSKAPHFNYIGDSIVGQGVNLGAHATLANQRLDKKEINIFFEGEKISTNKTKVGSFIGDYSTIGSLALLNPGTIVQKNTQILPLTTNKGFI